MSWKRQEGFHHQTNNQHETQDEDVEDEIEMRPFHTPLLDRKQVNVENDAMGKEGNKRDMSELKKEIAIVN